ncbi:hypothetical protein EVAR_552_1 [Eumeta japonica]|uniref:Uncharacterized protein n=1 Tax=Eumeta variegata TaxID=151549 RepID=A0A4C1SB15_EUMVA|nr:hypothetical protein EVAR_552_1 [Eumeta japonica]
MDKRTDGNGEPIRNAERNSSSGNLERSPNRKRHGIGLQVKLESGGSVLPTPLRIENGTEIWIESQTGIGTDGGAGVEMEIRAEWGLRMKELNTGDRRAGVRSKRIAELGTKSRPAGARAFPRCTFLKLHCSVCQMGEQGGRVPAAGGGRRADVHEPQGAKVLRTKRKAKTRANPIVPVPADGGRSIGW